MLIAWKRCFFRSEPSLPHLFFRASDVKLGPVPGKPLVQRMMRAASDWVDIQWTVVVTSLKSVAPRARGRLLDVGCGNKPYEAIFTPYVSEYIGIEHESTFALTSASDGASRPDFVYDGVTLPFPDRSFDTVLNVQVLEHTPNPGRLVAEMSRVLNENGILILVAPFSFRLHEEPHDYFRYSPHGLRHLCDEANLEVVEVQRQGSLWSVIGHKLNSYLAFRIARVGGMAQGMGKLGHEAKSQKGVRYWTLPFVGIAMIAITGTSRLFDRIFTEPDETLSFLILAQRKK
jgi:SAM-dependent methyltransferase